MRCRACHSPSVADVSEVSRGVDEQPVLNRAMRRLAAAPKAVENAPGAIAVCSPYYGQHLSGPDDVADW